MYEQISRKRFYGAKFKAMLVVLLPPRAQKASSSPSSPHPFSCSMPACVQEKQREACHWTMIVFASLSLALSPCSHKKVTSDLGSLSNHLYCKIIRCIIPYHLQSVAQLRQPEVHEYGCPQGGDGGGSRGEAHLQRPHAAGAEGAVEAVRPAGYQSK